VSGRVRGAIILSWLSLWVWPTAAGGAQAPALEERIRGVLNQPRLQQTEFSIHFCDLETGRTVFAHNADLPLRPASNMKLVTTAAACATLGREFEYQTVAGLLEGNLAILGGGDPLLGDPRRAGKEGYDIDELFRRILEQLRGRGLAAISGDLLLDDFLFDDVRFHPSWPTDQGNNWYTAQVSALNFNDNCLDVTARAGEGSGKPGVLSLKPDTRYVSVENLTETAASGRGGAWAVRKAGTNEITVRGSVRSESTFSVTVERPSAFFGQVLAEYLARHEAPIKGKLVIRQLRDEGGRPPARLDTLVTWKTPLAEVLSRANQDSLNLAAECLFKTLGVQKGASKGGGSWDSGRQAVTAFLGGLKVDADQYVIDDGSGLSRQNRLSAQCLTKVLCHMGKHPAGEMYRQSLATPEAGTLRRAKRFREPGYQGRLQAKTGYVNGAWALSGYAQRQSGEWVAFSILANGTSGPSRTAVLDEILKAVID